MSCFKSKASDLKNILYSELRGDIMVLIILGNGLYED